MRYGYVFVMAAWAGAVAAASAADVPGSHDHPMISRFAGSSIGGYQQMDYGTAVLPLGRAGSGGFAKADHVEGKITRILYLAPAGKKGVEVFRNFEEALAKAFAGYDPRQTS